MLSKIAVAVGRILHRLRVSMVILCIVATFNALPAVPVLASPICGPDPQGLYEWVCTGADTYTALAFSEKSWNWGASWHAATQQQAEAMALAECRKSASDCKSQIWAKNACVAWATSTEDGIWGTDWNIFVDTAEARALGNCRRAGGKRCVIRAHPCADD